MQSVKPMNQKSELNPYELIEAAEQAAGGTRALARALNWNSGALAAAKAGTRALPAYRAALMAELLGWDSLEWVLECLRLQSRTDEEREHWHAAIYRRAMYERLDEPPSKIDPVRLADDHLEHGRLNARSAEDRQRWKEARLRLRAESGHLSPGYDWPGLPPVESSPNRSRG